MQQPLPRQLIHQGVRVLLFLNLDPDIDLSFFLQLLHTHPPLLAIVLHLHRGHLPAPLKTRMGQRKATLTNPTRHGIKGDGSFSSSLPCIIIYLFHDFVDYVYQLCLASFCTICKQYFGFINHGSLQKHDVETVRFLGLLLTIIVLSISERIRSIPVKTLHVTRTRSGRRDIEKHLQAAVT